jgi:hypothetical protein
MNREGIMSGFLWVLVLILLAVLAFALLIWLAVRGTKKLAERRNRREIRREERSIDRELREYSADELAGTAINGEYAYAKAALNKLNDRQTLEGIVKNAKDRQIAQSAAEKICGSIGHDWHHCLCRRCGKRKAENDPGHDWELNGTKQRNCSLASSRGGGQHLDPCYGVDCASCSEGGYDDVFVCKTCGMEKQE